MSTIDVVSAMFALAAISAAVIKGHRDNRRARIKCVELLAVIESQSVAIDKLKDIIDGMLLDSCEVNDPAEFTDDDWGFFDARE